MGTIALGIDIGQKRDPTAVAVLETQERTGPTGRVVEHYVARHLERLPLGTPYPDVARRLAAIRRNLRQRISADEYEPPLTWLDATGVGQPVVDLLRAAGVPVTPVYFTHGDRLVEHEDRAITLGKAYLVSRLQVLLQSGRILLPKTREAQVLATELIDYEIRVSEDANDKYGAFKVGAHDDLVTALGLAVVAASRYGAPSTATVAMPTTQSASSFDAYQALSRQVEQAHAQRDQEMRCREAAAAGVVEGDDEEDPDEIPVAVAGMPRSTRDLFNPLHKMSRLRW